MSIKQISTEPVRRFYVGESFVELLPSSPYSAAYTPEHSVLGFAFDGQSGIHSFGNDHRQDFQTLPNSFAFVPAGCDVFSESEHGGEYLKISLAPDNPLYIAQSEPLNQLILTKSRHLAQELRTHLLISSIENTHNGNNILEPIFLENLLDQIKHELHLNNSQAEQSARIKHSLHRRQLANIEDYIDANIDNSISVQTMAEVVNMSAGYFSRAFKASFGVSPFDYVIQRRLARARSCLNQSNLDLSHIAFAHGFSSHAHMSMVFKKHLGLTPSQLRKTANS